MSTPRTPGLFAAEAFGGDADAGANTEDGVAKSNRRHLTEPGSRETVAADVVGNVHGLVGAGVGAPAGREGAVLAQI